MTNVLTDQTIGINTKSGKDHDTVVFFRTDGLPLRTGKEVYQMKSGERIPESGQATPSEERLLDELHSLLEDVQYNCITLGHSLMITIRKSETRPSNDQIDAVSTKCEILASVKDALTDIL